MVKLSTLIYICDNLDDENEKIIDFESVIDKEGDGFRDVWQFLDQHLIEVDQKVVERILSQVCQQ